VLLLRQGISFLLGMPLRFQDLPGVHAGKHMGYVLQWDYLAVPGLRGSERIRKPVGTARAQGLVHNFINTITYKILTAEPCAFFYSNGSHPAV
jgi:hypothetical protein